MAIPHFCASGAWSHDHVVDKLWHIRWSRHAAVLEDSNQEFKQDLRCRTGHRTCNPPAKLLVSHLGIAMDIPELGSTRDQMSQ